MKQLGMVFKNSQTNVHDQHRSNRLTLVTHNPVMKVLGKTVVSQLTLYYVSIISTSVSFLDVIDLAGNTAF